MAKLKAQVSVEMLILLGVLIVFTLPLIMSFYLHQQASKDRVAVEQAQRLADTLALNANNVYLDGEGSRTYVRVFIPAEAYELSLSSREVVVKLDTGFGKTEVVALAIAEFEPRTFSELGAGNAIFKLEYREGKVVVEK